MQGRPIRWAELQAAIRQRDVPAIMKLMFQPGTFELNVGFRTENEIWDFKKDCPKMGPASLNAWADLSKEILAMHNYEGGVLLFGMSDNYQFIGAKNRLDAKQLNDGLRRFISDRIWVDFHREFIQKDQSYLGLALIPPRGPLYECFTTDAPAVPGHARRLFLKGESAVRKGDSNQLLSTAEVANVNSLRTQPVVGREFCVDEPYYRILQPDYTSFVTRELPAAAIIAALNDPRVAVVSVVGIGGIGKTALATWCVLEAFNDRQYDFIVSITAKDRELSPSGIRALRPGLTSFDSLLDTILDVLGFPELKSLPTSDKETNVRELLKNSNGLLFVDNLETVDDARIIVFLDELPVGVKALITSRRTTVRRLVSPVDLGGLADAEVLQFIRSLGSLPGFEYALKLNDIESLRIGDACDRIPLAIRWILARSKSPAEAIYASDALTSFNKAGEELLEFSFRRIFELMTEAERSVLRVLSCFQKPLATEALVVGTAISQHPLEDALEALTRDALVQRQFDPDTNDYAFFLSPIPRTFVRAELTKEKATSDQILNRLTNWYEAKDIPDPEVRLIIRELRQGKGSPEMALVDLALAAERNKDYAGADKLYQQALTRVPTSWRAARHFAEFMRHKAKNNVEALNLYRRAAANAPRRGNDRAVIFREYGFLLRDSGEATATDSAIEQFRIALEETPNDPLAIFGLASMLERKGHYQEIVPLLEPLRGHSNPKTRERLNPILLKAYERTGNFLAAATLKSGLTST
jgi:tetratricopeptide (TPR) repeat protein